MKSHDLIDYAYTLSKFLGKQVDHMLNTHFFNGPFYKESNNPELNITLAKKSGVYLFSSSENEVWYVGKAASENLASEIWNKFSTRNVPFNHNWKNDRDIKNCIKETLETGEFILTIIEIEPKDFCSLFEVYLQTIYKRLKGELPALNKRIG